MDQDSDIEQIIEDFEESLTELIESAIAIENDAMEQVHEGRERRSPMFEFAHALKADRRFQSLPADKVLEIIRYEGFDLAVELPLHDDPEISLLVVWDRIVQPNAFMLAVAVADKWPLTVPAFTVKFCRFLAICRALQRQNPGIPFIVSVDVFARTLGVSSRTITDYRRFGELKGYLTVVESADWSQRRATRCLFAMPTSATTA